MAEVKWIKIVTDIFDDEKILLIESLPDADSIIVIWFKLLCLAGKQNNNGVFMMGNQIAYTDKMLAAVFRRKESTVQLALKTFEEFGMIEIVEGVITIPSWGKHQSLDQIENKKEYMRSYMQGYREKQKLLACKTNSKTNGKANVSSLEEDKEEEKEEDIIDYKGITEMYNSICVSFPKVRTLSEQRKRLIRARLKTYKPEDFKTLFEKAEASAFLKGKNKSNWAATFDWLLNEGNMAKVLDGNYDDRKPSGGENNFASYDLDLFEKMLNSDD